MALGVVARPSLIMPPLLVHQASNRAGLSFTLVKVRRAFAETLRRSLSGCLLSTGNIYPAIERRLGASVRDTSNRGTAHDLPSA